MPASANNWRAQLQLISIGILEEDRLRRHPIVDHWAIDLNTLLLQHIRCPIDVSLIDHERKMLRRPLSGVLLQHNHTRQAPGAEKEPISSFVAKPLRQSRHLAIKRFGDAAGP